MRVLIFHLFVLKFFYLETHHVSPCFAVRYLLRLVISFIAWKRPYLFLALTLELYYDKVIRSNCHIIR